MKPLNELLAAVASGALSVVDAEKELRSREVAEIQDATIDLGRRDRCGFGEVIYGEGKSADLIVRIARELLVTMPEVLVTRVSSNVSSACDWSNLFPRYVAASGTLRIGRDREPSMPSDTPETEMPPVIVVTAGSTDEAIAQEAAETLAWMGVPVRRLTDVGVAGPQRLLSRLDRFKGCAVAIVVAGMEGALPSVVAGHVPYPVIGIPTSVGYGASLGGFTALLSMLTSCAANVTVVNVDAGFKGGYIAGLIASRSNRDSQ